MLFLHVIHKQVYRRPIYPRWSTYSKQRTGQYVLSML